MLTHFRYKSPQFTGDWKADGPVWSKATADYWLSLEKKGALAIQPIDIQHLPIFHVDDYIKSGDTDHTVGIQAAVTALTAHGRGVLSFGKKAYTVFTNSTTQTFAINVSGLTNVAILGNGCTITSGRGANQATADLNFIYATPVTGLYVEGFKFVGSNSGTASNSGEKFLVFGGGCKSITVVNCDVRNCEGGIRCGNESAKNRGLALVDCYFEKCFYPLAIYCTDDVFARYTSISGGRCYFPSSRNGIGCSNHDISVTSSSAYTSSDCLLSVGCKAVTAWLTATSYAVDDLVTESGKSYRCLVAHTSGTFATDLAAAKWALDAARSELTNIRLNYYSPGRADGATDGVDALIHLAPQQLTATSAAAIFQNIHVNVMVEGKNIAGEADDDQPYILLITKLDHNGAGDSTARGHRFENVTVGGVAHNWDDALGGLRFFDTTVVSGGTPNWSGDFACSLAVRDFVINGNPVNDCIWVDGKAAVSGKPFLAIDNVSCLDGTYTEANCAGANIAHRNFAASNLSAADRRLEDFTPTGNGITFSSAAGRCTKNGRIVTVWFDVTWPNTADGGEARIGSFPFTVANEGEAQDGNISFTDVGATHTLAAIGNTTYAKLFTTSGAAVTNATMSQKRLIGKCVYWV